MPYIIFDRHEADDVRHQWGEHIKAASARVGIPIRLQIIVSPFRTSMRPMANFIRDEFFRVYKDQQLAVIIPRQLHLHWWEYPIHRFVAQRVKHLLLQERVSTKQIIDLPFVIGKKS